MTKTQQRNAIAELCNLQRSLSTTVASMIEIVNDARIGSGLNVVEGFGVIERNTAAARKAYQRIITVPRVEPSAGMREGK